MDGTTNCRRFYGVSGLGPYVADAHSNDGIPTCRGNNIHDFLHEFGHQLVNRSPKTHFMTGGKSAAPAVMRTRYSLGRNAGAVRGVMR